MGLVFINHYLMIRKSIPNLITCLNLTCGVLAIMSNDLVMGVYLIILAGIFDIFDGLVARILKVSSIIGKELDSLADIVSFGVAPAILFYKAFAIQENNFYLLGPILIAMAGALRLARFNTSESTTTYFEGLAIPASGLMLCGLVYGADIISLSLFFFLLISIILAALNVSSIKMFSFKQFGQKLVKTYFGIILIIGVAVLIWQPSLALSAIIGSYIAIACMDSLRISRENSSY